MFYPKFERRVNYERISVRRGGMVSPFLRVYRLDCGCNCRSVVAHPQRVSVDPVFHGGGSATDLVAGAYLQFQGSCRRDKRITERNVPGVRRRIL